MLKRILHITLIILILCSVTPSYAAGVMDQPSEGPVLSFFGNSLTMPVSDDYTIGGQEGILYLYGKNKAFSAVITRDKLDDATLEALRSYYDDDESSISQLFEKLLQYKKSYFSALQEYYKKEFLYGNDNLNNERNLVVFGSYNEPIFGKYSDTLLYNILREGPDGPYEETRIAVTVPVRSDMSIYSITFVLDKGMLNQENIAEMSALISGIEIKGLPKQTKKLKVFNDSDSVKRANLGIYPPPGSIKSSYSEIANRRAGYSLTAPASILSYRQNSVVSPFDFKSWKTGLHQYFSISVEPAFNNIYAIEDKIKMIKSFNSEKIKNPDEKLTQIYKNYFYQFNYELTDNGSTTYLQDFFLVQNGRLYNLHFSSSDKLTGQMEKDNLNLVASFKLESDIQKAGLAETSLRKYTDIKDGYSISYPPGWQKVKSPLKDQEFDAFQLVNSALSGSVDVLVAEGEFYCDTETNKQISLLTGAMDQEAYKYLRRYSAPYLNKKSKLLTFSMREINGVKYLYKLINYIDSNDRSKLSYSVDIIKDKSIYSLFITLNDYAAEDGNLINSRIYDSLTSIAASFKLDATPEEKTGDMVSYLAKSMIRAWN